jgi:predicted PurR-regulated permease PerM
VSGLRTGLSALGGFLFAIVISLYTAVSIKDYFRSIVEAFPKKYHKKVEEVLSKCASTIRLWFRAQLIDMLILGAMTGFGLWLLGVDYWAVYVECGDFSVVVFGPGRPLAG